MAHSLIAPSAAGIWGAPGGCTGYVTMAQMYPGVETEDTREGSAAHELAGRMIDSYTRGRINWPSPESVINTPASNGVILTDEIYESAQAYADDVNEVMQSTRVFGGECFGVEETITAPRVSEYSFGAVDTNLFVRGPKVLYIWDFKHGREIVEVFENWQIINYASGLIDKYCALYGLMDLDIKVIARIVQPRAFHRDGIIREWAFQASDIRGHINILAANAAIALSPDAVCRSGSSCKYCPARHACPTALKAGMSLYEMSLPPIPEELPPEAVGLQYAIVKRAREQLEFLESGFEEQLKGLISRGVNVPGFMLMESLGRETWAKPIEEVIKLGEMLGVDLRNKNPITPKQAKKAGLNADVVKSYSYTPNNGLKLVSTSQFNGRKIFS